MNKQTKLFTLVAILLPSLIIEDSRFLNLKALEKTSEEILLENGFNEDELNGLSSFTKNEIAKQINDSVDFSF